MSHELRWLKDMCYCQSVDTEPQSKQSTSSLTVYCRKLLLKTSAYIKLSIAPIYMPISLNFIQYVWRYPEDESVTKHSLPRSSAFHKPNLSEESKEECMMVKQWSSRRQIWNTDAPYRSEGKILRRGAKPVFLAQNLAFNSDAAPNYKHMFGPNKCILSHHWNITMKYAS